MKLRAITMTLTLAAGGLWAAEPYEAPDLNPVKALAMPKHAPVELVRRGKPVAQVYVDETNASANLRLMLGELVEAVRLTSGATLEVATNPPAANQPAIVIGECAETRAAGIDAAQIPIEGFVVKTAPNRVYLVGSTAALPARRDAYDAWANDGTAWAVADFLERFVGVRWFWPTTAAGRSVVEHKTLRVPPMHYTDAPVFRKREFYPPHGYRKDGWRAIWWDKDAPLFPAETLFPGTEHFAMQPLLPGLRAGNSWPYVIKVHQPQHFAAQRETYIGQPDMFQRSPDGSPDLRLLCYSSQKAFDYLIQGCMDAWDHGKPVPWVTTTCVTVSPGDYVVRCHCDVCGPLFEPARAPYGSSSRVMCLFVKRLCEEVKKRWPDKKVLYLPYWNYTDCIEEIEYPGNLEIQMCTMAFGLMRQADARGHMEKQLRAWSKKVGGRIQTWEYSHRLHEWTYAPVQYPHLVQDYYRANRSVLAGSFLNGGQIGEWTTGAPGNYVWMKVLWNPDVNVDALLDALCDRMFGKAAKTCRELLRLECERWEKAPWRQGLGDAGRVSPEVFADTWPPEVVAKMKELRDRARREMKGDALAEQRFAYWTWTFDHFLKEAEDAWKKTGIAVPGDKIPAGAGVQNRYETP